MLRGQRCPADTENPMVSFHPFKECQPHPADTAQAEPGIPASDLGLGLGRAQLKGSCASGCLAFTGQLSGAPDRIPHPSMDSSATGEALQVGRLGGQGGQK